MKRTLALFGLSLLLIALTLPAFGQGHPYDEPNQAKEMKLPNLPAVVNIADATVSGTEPVDPLAPALTNTVWAKFTLTAPRLVGFQNFYYNNATLFFSLFTKSGSSYNPATGYIVSFNDILLAGLNPGTYYLRIGVVDEPGGTDAVFITFTGIAYLTPPNFEFSIGFTEGAFGATSDSTGWTAPNATAGDGFICENTGPYDCYFQFTSAGAGENTKLKSVVTLNGVKAKTGDIIRFQPSLSDVTGQPNLKAKLVLTDAANAKQKYVFNITDGSNTEPQLTAVVPANFVPVKAVIVIKNKDLDTGDLVQIDGVTAALIRPGEGLRTALPLPMAWATKSSGKGALPLPASAK